MDFPVRKIARTLFVLAAILAIARFSSAQDESIGDVARAARAEKTQSPHAKKVLTDEDIGPQLHPISETDDPADVVNKAVLAWQATTIRTCRHEVTNNSGPGSSGETMTEISGSDYAHLVNTQRGSNPSYFELIQIGRDSYTRKGSGPWAKDTAEATPDLSLYNHPPEEFQGGYTSGELRLVRRDVISGSPTFMYETKYHPGGVSNRDKTIDIWVGANDGLPRKAQMIFSENTARFIPPTVTMSTTTCSYGPVTEIKPPL